MRNAGLEESQAEIKIAGRIINNLRYADHVKYLPSCLVHKECSVNTGDCCPFQESPG